MANNIFSKTLSFEELNEAKIKRFRKYAIAVNIVLCSPMLMLIGRTDYPWHVVVLGYLLVSALFCGISAILPIWDAKKQFNNQLKAYNHPETIEFAGNMNFSLSVVNADSNWNFTSYIAKGVIAGYPVEIDAKVNREQNLIILFRFIPKEIGKGNYQRLQKELKQYQADFDFGGISICIPISKLSQAVNLIENTKAVAAIIQREGFAPDYPNT